MMMYFVDVCFCTLETAKFASR